MGSACHPVAMGCRSALRGPHESVTDLGGAGKQQGAGQSRNHQFEDHVSERIDLEAGERIETVGPIFEADENSVCLVCEDQQPAAAGPDIREPLGIPLG
jgi:hypothetical protein